MRLNHRLSLLYFNSSTYSILRFFFHILYDFVQVIKTTKYESLESTIGLVVLNVDVFEMPRIVTHYGGVTHYWVKSVRVYRSILRRCSGWLRLVSINLKFRVISWHI